MKMASPRRTAVAGADPSVTPAATAADEVHCGRGYCTHKKWAQGKEDPVWFTSKDGLSMRTGIFPHTLHCIPESCDVSAASYFGMCTLTVYMAMEVAAERRAKGHRVHIDCVTTSLSFRKSTPKDRLEHLHSWVCFGTERHDVALSESYGRHLRHWHRDFVPPDRNFVQAFNAHPGSGCFGRRMGTRAKYMSHKPWAGDKVAEEVTGDTLRVMLSSTAAYEAQFCATYKGLMGRDYVHGRDICFTFVQFRDDVPYRFLMSVYVPKPKPATEAKVEEPPTRGGAGASASTMGSGDQATKDKWEHVFSKPQTERPRLKLLPRSKPPPGGT